MNTPRRITLVGLLLVLGAVTFMGAAGCGGGGEDVNPSEILRRASTSMQQIDGFHFVYEVHLPSSAEPDPGLFIARITGDVNSEGSMRSVVDATFGGLPASIGLVIIGDTYYFQDPLSKKWQTLAAADSPIGKLNLQTGTIQILQRITDAVYEGTQKRGGAKTHHFSGRIAAEEVKAIAGAVSTTDTFPADVWIGVDDHLVYEVNIKGPAVRSEPPEIRRSIIFSNLDVFVDIHPPQ